MQKRVYLHLDDPTSSVFLRHIAVFDPQKPPEGYCQLKSGWQDCRGTRA